MNDPIIIGLGSVIIFLLCVQLGLKVHTKRKLAQVARTRQTQKPDAEEYSYFTGVNVGILQAQSESTEALAIPTGYEMYLRTPNQKDLALLLLQIRASPDLEGLSDKRRLITISSAVHGFYLPRDIVLMDKRTFGFYATIKAGLELTRPAKALEMIEYLDQYSDQKTQYLTRTDKQRTSAVASMIDKIGGFILNFKRQNNFPAYPQLVNYINTTDKNFFVYIEREGVELKSAITAYAIMTDITIPVSYVNYDDLTFSIIEILTPNLEVEEELVPVQEPLLRIVK